MPNLSGTSGAAPPKYGTNGKAKINVTTKNVLRGINWAEVKGRHKLEKAGPTILARNPHVPDLKKKHLKLDTEKDMDVRGGVEIDEKKTAQNEFLASNSDMRGKQATKVFRGNRVYNWDPRRDFRPDAVGDVRQGGAFKGGFLNESLQKARKGYAPHIGHQKKGLAINGETLRNVNPFSVSLRVRPSDLKVGARIG